MCLVSCRRQGILTQGHESDPKCKLIISSFVTLPHLLDCLICTRNAMSIVLLLKTMGGRIRWVMFDLYWGVGRGTGSRYHLIAFVFFSCAFAFCSFMFSIPLFRYLEHDAVMSVSLFSLSLVPLATSY